jgi:hypothetical protein
MIMTLRYGFLWRLCVVQDAFQHPFRAYCMVFCMGELQATFASALATASSRAWLVGSEAGLKEAGMAI